MTVIVKSKTPIVVPPSVRRQAGLKSGDKLEFRVSGRVITILPNVPKSDDEYTPAQRRAIDRGIAQSEKEYAQGKSYGPFVAAAEAIASLDANLRRRVRAKKLKSPLR
jgi:bifunctional DNA-binding transcriptional regulator/antitoxin component of YhaV-PrlF toxin-antitoxin module